jgi:taurine--2-oxoglutarate transaminase
MQHDKLVEKARDTGEYLAAILKEIAVEHPSVGDVRSIGLFAAIELVKNRETREPISPYGSSSPAMNEVKKYLLAHGVFAYTHWNIILIIPPLIITREQLDEGLSVINDALSIIDNKID